VRGRAGETAEWAPAVGGLEACIRLASPEALNPDRDAAFLDIDGTLAPLMPHPDDVKPDAERTEVLHAVRRALGGAVAVISGRSLADIDRILGDDSFAAAGVHGLERRSSGGEVDQAPPHPALVQAAVELRRIAELDPGLLVEDKGLGVTLHYRRAPQFEAQAVATAERIAQTSGLAMQRGDCIVELRTPGRDKGDALRAFMAEPPFAGRRPIFVGDDLTDEHGFEAAAALGGYGVLVGDRAGSAAAYRLADPAAVLVWLRRAGAGAP
jgi:trehalose 6-phosphate phosphatase